jgi:hypothetical protein
MNYAHRISQHLVDSNSVQNGDFNLDLSGKVVDLQVTCLSDSGYNVLVGWNEQANKDLIVPGESRSYGVAERGFLDGNKLAINFASSGAGNKRCLVTIWTQREEIC